MPCVCVSSAFPTKLKVRKEVKKAEKRHCGATMPKDLDGGYGWLREIAAVWQSLAFGRDDWRRVAQTRPGGGMWRGQSGAFRCCFHGCGAVQTGCTGAPLVFSDAAMSHLQAIRQCHAPSQTHLEPAYPPARRQCHCGRIPAARTVSLDQRNVARHSAPRS
ncbi:uncharacterized protein E0L32_008753 [Thyridium curvatum]|uniref:Uncharacterized protein n=1 Tax=Thyridium curvatum TaxID=1093900 RepID=A0A507B033_9PEZI|nr:uncharacterized protein E0L32_008753 [Thyridium curvatum]TPX10348.1 hypothetical protein E0L32_008753 [Thyridium curvatum]